MARKLNKGMQAFGRGVAKFTPDAAPAAAFLAQLEALTSRGFLDGMSDNFLRGLPVVRDFRGKVRVRQPRLPVPAGAVFQIKIALAGARPPIWRRVLIDAGLHLGELHEVVQAAMGWHGYHLHCFEVDGETYGDPENDDLDEREARLGELVGPGDRLHYEYDFGDGWKHVLTVEKALPCDPNQKTYPVCLKGKGACPPEDCGGLWSYYAKLEALKDPNDPDHEEAVEDLGMDWDPQAFDLAVINAALTPRPIAKRKRT